MKTLLITDNFLPHIGGSRIYYYNIFRRFPGNEVVILTKKFPGTSKFDKTSGIRTFRVPLPTLRSRKIEWIVTHCSLLISAFFIYLRFRPDIIHCGEVIPSGTVGMILSKIFKIPYVVYLHNSEVAYTGFRTEKRIFFKILRSAAVIIAACRFIQDFFKDKLPGKDIMLVNPCLDKRFDYIEGFNAHSFKKTLGLENKHVLLTVARLEKRKGIDSVIKVLPNILKRFKDVIYIVVGEGPDRTMLGDLVREHNISKAVTFVGALEQKEVKKYFSICDIFVMPNREESFGDIEGFGMVFIEAQAFGKPVIGGKSGGVMDSIDDGITGLLIKPNDANHLEQSLTKLLSDSDYAQKMGAAARLKAEGWPAWDTAVKAILAISCNVINPKKTIKARNSG